VASSETAIDEDRARFQRPFRHPARSARCDAALRVRLAPVRGCRSPRGLRSRK
jgi:hypothetical protein